MTYEIEIAIPRHVHQAVLEYCDRYATELGIDKSRFKGPADRIFTGKLGEVVVAHYFGIGWARYLRERPFVEPGWDIVLAGTKYDVKTAVSKTPPTTEFWYNVEARQYEQLRPDGYIFCTLIKGGAMAYIAGYISKQAFGKQATPRAKGWTSPTTRFKFPCDAYSVEIWKLKDLAELKGPPAPRGRSVGELVPAPECGLS